VLSHTELRAELPVHFPGDVPKVDSATVVHFEPSGEEELVEFSLGFSEVAVVVSGFQEADLPNLSWEVVGEEKDDANVAIIHGPIRVAVPLVSNTVIMHQVGGDTAYCLIAEVLAASGLLQGALENESPDEAWNSFRYGPERQHTEYKVPQWLERSLRDVIQGYPLGT